MHYENYTEFFHEKITNQLQESSNRTKEQNSSSCTKKLYIIEKHGCDDVE